MPRKIIYLINPISGTKKKEKIRELISSKTRDMGILFEILPSRADGDYHDLRLYIQNSAVSDVVICGGDGTLNAVTNALQGVDVNIGIIPIGSGNSVALAAKIPRQPVLALDIIFKGSSSPVDAFSVNEKFSCALCGIGFDALVAHEFAKQKTRGLQTYIRISITKFFNSKPYPFEIRVKDKILKTDAYFISIANSNQFGNNFTIAPKASLSDGLLDVVIVKKTNKIMLLYSVLRQLAGKNRIIEVVEYVEKKNVIYLQTDRLDILNPAHAPMHIDGEPLDTSGEFRIRMIRNCFKLIQP